MYIYIYIYIYITFNNFIAARCLRLNYKRLHGFTTLLYIYLLLFSERKNFRFLN